MPARQSDTPANGQPLETPRSVSRFGGRETGSCPMPELPDILVYVERLRAFTSRTGRSRAVEGLAALRAALGHAAAWPKRRGQTGARGHPRIAKQIVLALEDVTCTVVFHLMVAGRLRWQASERAVENRAGRWPASSFDHGVLYLTEAGQKAPRIAALWCKAASALELLDRGGLAAF